jgi:hypothetical protein
MFDYLIPPGLRVVKPTISLHSIRRSTVTLARQQVCGECGGVRDFMRPQAFRHIFTPDKPLGTPITPMY